MTVLVDADARTSAVTERVRNVVVEASAGTGKTSVIVDRIVGLVAPASDAPPLAIDRVAAITFTRKAAGELRVRTRQRLLGELAMVDVDSLRADHLRHAIAGLDTAHIGTIHGFADRLLRRWAIAVGLDPHYELEEHDWKLVDACFRGLVRASAFDELEAAGLRVHSYDGWHHTVHGVESFVSDVLRQRDVAVATPDEHELRREDLARYARELAVWVEPLSDRTVGGRWLKQLGLKLREALTHDNPATLYREIVTHTERGPCGKASAKPRLKNEFEGDRFAWNAWKAFDGDGRVQPVRPTSLREDLLAPLRQWLAVKLLRLRPAILSAYEEVKRARQVVDHIDLLLKLRNLLRDDLAARIDCQNLFDHILVDELQDTDPLQAEVIAFLCERGSVATEWRRVVLAPGRLTIVGDPKQSIYRFRRADLRSYQRLVDLVSAGPCVNVELATSFRSTPRLVSWLNARCEAVLEAARGTPDRVRHRALAVGRATGHRAPVHVVHLEAPSGTLFDEVRALEADALARYVRHLVTSRTDMVVDRWSGQERAIEYSDIAVLAIRTTNLPMLFRAFDRDAVPHAARGGTLFLSDPLVQQFLHGLCAIADRDDGVANVTLLRHPFFPIRFDDLARLDRRNPSGPVAAARTIITDLRRRRFQRSVGATARALLAQTGLARAAATQPNGAQRLAMLRELCFQLDETAASEQLDFDATMELRRAWLDAPGGLDPPHPVGRDAVRVTTLHQAKGLEYPVVVLWDCRAGWLDEGMRSAWSVDRDGQRWSLRLDGLTWDEPRGDEHADDEVALREAERRRLVYVAATRARDLVVIPTLRGDDARWMWRTLLGEQFEVDANVSCTPVHSAESPAGWYSRAAVPASTKSAVVSTADREARVQLQRSWSIAAAPHDRPLAFTDASATRAWWGRAGRHGIAFGDAVHRAIGDVLTKVASPVVAVRRAYEQVGVTAFEAEAVADVERTIRALAAHGWLEASDALRLEYPLACRTSDGMLRAGYADLVICRGSEVIVVDFKTDLAPTESEGLSLRYVAQVEGYAHALDHAFGAGTNVSAALLYTIDGTTHWLRRRPA